MIQTINKKSFVWGKIFLDIVCSADTLTLVMKTNTTTTTINSKVNSDATIPLRVPSSLKDALLIAATKDDRSLSSYIKRVLEAHVASLEAATTATFTMSAKPKAKAKAKK